MEVRRSISRGGYKERKTLDESRLVGWLLESEEVVVGHETGLEVGGEGRGRSGHGKCYYRV